MLRGGWWRTPCTPTTRNRTHAAELNTSAFAKPSQLRLVPVLPALLPACAKLPQRRNDSSAAPTPNRQDGRIACAIQALPASRALSIS